MIAGWLIEAIFAQQRTAPEAYSGAAWLSGLCTLIARVPEDHVAAFLALDRGEVRIDPAGTNLRVGEGQRNIFASRCFRLAHPAAADFCVMQSSA